MSFILFYRDKIGFVHIKTSTAISVYVIPWNVIGLVIIILTASVCQ